MTFAMPSMRAYRATDDLAREIVSRFARWSLIVLGLLVIMVGMLVSPLPGPGGIPLIVVGL